MKNSYYDSPVSYRMMECVFNALEVYRDKVFDTMTSERDTFKDDMGMWIGGYCVINKFLDVKYWDIVEPVLKTHLPEIFNDGGEK